MSIAGRFSDFPGFAFGGIAFLIFMLFLYTGMGFLMTALSCAIYILVANWTGGIEVEIEVMEDQEK